MTEKLTGLPQQSSHPAYWIAGFIVLGIITLIVLRVIGFFAPRENNAKQIQTLEKFSRAYVPLGTIDSKLFYYDRHDQKICEYENYDCRERGALPSVESAVISPDLKKIAILSTKEVPKSGIYLLDLSTSDQPSLIQQQLPQVAKSEWLPTGYRFQPTSSIYWSQESKQIAFVAFKDSHADIFVVSIQPDASQPSSTPDPTKREQPEQQTKRIEPIRNPGSHVGAIIWRGERSLIFVTELDGKDAMYEVGSNGGGIVQLKPN